MTISRILVCTLCSCFAVNSLQAAPPGLIEVQVGKELFSGKVVAHNEQLCWLLARDGGLHRFEADRVEKFRQVSPRFEAWTMPTVRDQLRRELGNQFAVVGTRHYLVCGRNERAAGQYAAVLEDLFRSFHLYFSVRGFKIPEPEFPLVAIVFPDQAAFAKYAAGESLPVAPSLRGYYIGTSNRIALFENRSQPVSATGALGSIDAGLEDTMIHEATHQMAFNTGLHTRIGTNPKWVVEGLATVFEAPGIRNSSSNLGSRTRINAERLVWFGNFNATRRKSKSLEAFVRDDQMFDAAVLDAYSQAWALTFFLIETRSRAYSQYLALVNRRNPLAVYGPEERLADFRQAFGSDTALLEAEFLRFIMRTSAGS